MMKKVARLKGYGMESLQADVGMRALFLDLHKGRIYMLAGHLGHRS